MKIGFDISQTSGNKAGCGYFAAGLLSGLAEVDTQNSYELYTSFGDFYFNPAAPHSCPISKPNFRLGRRHSLQTTASLFWSQSPAELEAALGSPDIVHANNFYCPNLPNTRVVYTLYDLGFLENPDWTTESNRWGCFQGVFAAAQHADHIIAISEFSRDHFLRTFPNYPVDRISVVYPASRFTAGTVFTRPARLERLLPEKFWLTVGTLEPRKNHLRTLQAFKRLLDSGKCNFPLVVAGGKGWMMEDFDQHVTEMGLSDFVVQLGYVDDAELGWLYSNCFANLYPSLFEGFGMPILEGMTLGAIPIAGNNSSQPEIVGDAGFLVQTADSESIFDAMATLLAEPDNCPIRKRLGVEKSSAFSWEASCRKLLEIYSVANTSNKLKCQFPSR